MTEKRCSRCKEVKPVSEFPRRSNKKSFPSGFYIYCTLCAREDNHQRYLEKRPDRLKAAYRWYRDGGVGRKARHRLACVNRYERIRVEIREHYGKVCACCGEDNPAFLTLDHVHNNGADERKRLKADGAWYHLGGVGFYARLKKLGFPSGYQTLCFNCNCAKGRFGECPHQTQAKLFLVRSAS